MKSIYKILGIFLILAAVSLSGCIGEDVPADNETEVVIVDEPIDVVVDEPIADESDAPVYDEQEDDEAEDEVISKPSSSGNLVAGVDGTTGHGAEIVAKREAAEAARLAMLNALSDSLPDAIDDVNNATSNFTELNESYINETGLMNAYLSAETNFTNANASVIVARNDLNAELEAYDADMEVYDADMEAYNTSVENCTYPHGIEELIDESIDIDNTELVPPSPEPCTCLAVPEEPAQVSDKALEDALRVESDASDALDDAFEALGDITAESIEELRLAVEEAQISLDEAISFREECQAAFDLLHPVAEPEE